MPRASRLVALTAAALLATGLAACSSSSDDNGSGDGDWTPITIQHALGTTTIDEKPERVATVNWANHEVPLALGVVPVGMAAANFGDDDGDGVLPWVEEKLQELKAPTPVLFDETDGVDFEAVANTQPDVILAGYSGLTQEDYNTLSEIAPVVAYPVTAWGTPWRETIELNSKAIGKENEGKELVSQLEKEIADAAAEHPQIAGKNVMFLTHVDTTDLSEVSFYTTHDTRAAFFEDLGMATPPSIATASAGTEKFSLSQSAEQVDALNDVDVIVTYGGADLVNALKADPLLSKMPAVASDAIVTLPSSDPLGTAANPTPLSISWVLDDYLSMLAQASGKVQ
ncbi:MULTISPECIES: iron-siderophore ABC transporter substrate-binding protein [Williamsia]|uniref:iron-siderophore ABC transporter substrate-binding protein n=1 Tax=Williamsia TaxID=85043 RepID=UPI0004201964|nr:MULTISPECIES: iron-siderophore ABC transporter substrate-binding protein [Williamsia]PVY30953.1 iron complex transport system substrate-binding protein [Williamsia marianensis]PZU04443.1 MAG: iron-siderophore ABC transporter substrate-binding protein [Gordonia sp. (in: high G+C Gram-positive bacteria)]